MWRSKGEDAAPRGKQGNKLRGEAQTREHSLNIRRTLEGEFTKHTIEHGFRIAQYPNIFIVRVASRHCCNISIPLKPLDECHG